MKKKNYKIRIKKNHIIKEDGAVDLFGSEVAEIGKAIADEGKMIATSVMRVGNIYKNTTKSLYFMYTGDDESFAEVQREFLRDQQKYKTEQDALLKAQPGFADLQKFLGMTSPGILLFDRFCGIDKVDLVDKLERMRDRKNARARRNESIASYLNFIYYLCYYLDNSFNIKKHAISEEAQSKGKFKIDLASNALSITKTKNFKKALALLINKKVNKNKGYEFKSDFSVSSKAREILQKTYRSASSNHNDIKKILKKNYSAQSTFSILAENFKSESWTKIFDIDFQNFDFNENDLFKESYLSKKSTLKITKNNLLIKEAEEEPSEEEPSEEEPEMAEEPSEEEVKEEESIISQLSELEVPAKESALLSNIVYSLKRLELASAVFTNIFDRMYEYTSAKKNHFEGLSLNAKIDKNDFEKKMSVLLNEIDVNNKKINTYNSLFNSKITQINKKATEEVKKGYIEGENKINEEIDKNEKIAQSQFSSLENSQEIFKASRFVTSFSILIEVIKDGELVKTLEDGTNNIEKYIKFYKEIVNEDKIFIKDEVPKTKIKGGNFDAKQLIEKNTEALTKINANIDASDIDSIDSLYNKTIASYNKLVNLSKEFNKFTSKEDDLQSKLELNLKIIPEAEVVDDDKEDKNSKEKSSYTEITYVKN